MALLDSAKTQIQKQKQPKSIISNPMADSGIPPGGGNGKHTPPKDFVCPITSNLFDDPVTLETGQTYERRAIHEWLERGNLSCPITRQKLQSGQLPKTNYVLKRLIASWKEQNSVIRLDKPDSLSDQTEPATVKTALELSTSPNSVISQVTIDGDMNGLRQAIATLCTSESLNETETAALRIEQFWNDGNAEISIQTMLSKPPVINGFMEILFNSVNPQVLKSMIVLLSELGLKENSVIQTLTQVESDVDCIMALFKNGLLEAVVLIYLLGPSRISLIEMEMVGSLIKVIKSREDEFVKMNLKPKAAATILLGQIVGDGKEVSVCSSIANAVVAEQGIETVVGSLGGETAEERIAAVGVLLACIQAEGKCRSIIVDKAELAPVLESFMDAADGQRFLIIQFLAELVKLNRRTLNEQVLHIIKDEGAYSTMHTLLVYLQIADHDQCPVVAGLLLQLDLLEEPRKMSIYREEAIDALILCLRNSSFPTAQIAAAETIVSLQGRFSAAGEPLNRALLLKRAGIDKSYRKRMRRDHLSNSLEEFEETTKEEERVADEWERKMAFVLVSHEFGLLFEALAEGLKSKNEALHSACLVSATWLTHMLRVLPDTGIQGAAQFCLLKHFASLFISATDIEDKALSLLALSSFIRDPEARQSLSSYMKDIMRGLRELKKASPLAFEILKVLSEGNDSSSELWNHKELVQVDCSENGEVLCIVYFKDKIFSGHSDGTIKVWTGRGSILHLVQEIQEHTKAVMSLVVSESGEKLYSGSLDKTIKVWSIGNDTIHCVQVHDMKDQVHNLVVAKSILCFIPHGAGVKIRSWEGESKLLNTSKYIKCLALVRGKLYCGCHDNSIQEIDLPTGTLSSIQSGSRKLLGKGNPIHALQVHSGQIFTASSPLDGAAVKIWSESSYSMIGSLPTLLDVRTMAISSELVYLGGKGGTVEIWDRDKQNRVDTLQTGRNCKVICMVLDENEEILIIGTSDGRIQSWGLN